MFSDSFGVYLVYPPSPQRRHSLGSIDQGLALCFCLFRKVTLLWIDYALEETKLPYKVSSDKCLYDANRQDHRTRLTNCITGVCLGLSHRLCPYGLCV